FVPIRRFIFTGASSTRSGVTGSWRTPRPSILIENRLRGFELPGHSGERIAGASRNRSRRVPARRAVRVAGDCDESGSSAGGRDRPPPGSARGICGKAGGKGSGYSHDVRLALTNGITGRYHCAPFPPYI